MGKAKAAAASTAAVQAASAAKIAASAATAAVKAAQDNSGPTSTLSIPTLYSLLQEISFTLVVKVLCMVGNVLVQISPLPQVKRWEKRHTTGESDAAPYMSIAFGGWQWCFYGTLAWLLTKRSGFLILVYSNCLGALLGTYYAIAFYRNCQNDSSRNNLQKYISAVTSLVVFQAVQICVLPAERALFLTGLISSFCSFVGAISMLVTVPVVLRCKDSRSIPGPLCLANFMSANVWCICGWMLDDPMVSTPNVIGVMSSALCLYLKFLYPAAADADDDDDETYNKASKLAAKKLSHFAPDEMTPLKAHLRAKSRLAAAALPPSVIHEPIAAAEDVEAMQTILPSGTGGTW